VDELLKKKQADSFVWHSRYQVYVATFFVALCLELHHMVQAETGFYVLSMLNESVADGIKSVPSFHHEWPTKI
jgi:hypothetical protein